MAVSPERLKELRRMQQVIALDDPAILELDVANEDHAYAIDIEYRFRQMAEYGEPFTVRLSEHEWLEITRTGFDHDKGAAFDIMHYSHDKKISPAAAEIIAILAEQFGTEEGSTLVEG